MGSRGNYYYARGWTGGNQRSSSGSAEHGGSERGAEYIVGFIAGIFSLILKSLGGLLPAGTLSAFSLAFSIIPFALLALLIIGIVEEGLFFACGYWIISWLLFTGKLIGTDEVTFDIFFPLWLLFTIFYFKEDVGNGEVQPYFLGVGAIAIICIAFFFWVGGGNPSTSSAVNATLNTTTVNTTVAATTIASTSTSTSVSTTTTILSYCINETDQPFLCNEPKMANYYLSFNLTENGPGTLYDINLACATVLLHGLKTNQFYPLYPNGTLNYSQATTGTQMSYGNVIHVSGLPCMGGTSGASYNGTVWVNYTANGAAQWLNDPIPVYVNVTKHA